jgi:hypothetical protein
MAFGGGQQLGPARYAIAAGALMTGWSFGETAPWARIAARLRIRFSQLNLTRDQIFQIHQEWDKALGTGRWMRSHRTQTMPHYDHVWNPGIQDAYAYQYSFRLVDPATGNEVIRRGFVHSDSILSPDQVRDEAQFVIAALIELGRHSLPGAAAADIQLPRVRIEAAYRR